MVYEILVFISGNPTKLIFFFNNKLERMAPSCPEKPNIIAVVIFSKILMKFYEHTNKIKKLS